MVMETPQIRKMRMKARAELMLLRAKEKIKGCLSSEDEERKKELMRMLSLRY